jgi:hypothetical protein
MQAVTEEPKLQEVMQRAQDQQRFQRAGVRHQQPAACPRAAKVSAFRPPSDNQQADLDQIKPLRAQAPADVRLHAPTVPAGPARLSSVRHGPHTVAPTATQHDTPTPAVTPATVYCKMPAAMPYGRTPMPAAYRAQSAAMLIDKARAPTGCTPMEQHRPGGLVLAATLGGHLSPDGCTPAVT